MGKILRRGVIFEGLQMIFNRVVCDVKKMFQNDTFSREFRKLF